jgi:hypothetical protein
MDMPMSGLNKCSVPECDELVGDYANLCDRHKIPGVIVEIGQSTMIVTVWVAEHGGEVGFILLNDYALGDLFGGRAGFEAKLAQQGFTKVRNVESPLQFDSEKARIDRPASWSGPWLTEYPWEVQ